MRPFIGDLLADQEGQDIAEYAVMLATILGKLNLNVTGQPAECEPQWKIPYSTSNRQAARCRLSRPCTTSPACRSDINGEFLF